MSGERQDIKDQLKYNPKIELEYGIPLDSLPYKKIWEKIAHGYSEEIITAAIDVVESEARKGNFGAFVVKRLISDRGDDNIEVWSAAD